MENKEEQIVVEENKEQVQEPQQQTTSAPAEPVKKPGIYTAGLVCGIVGLCLFWCVWIGLICGILGIVFGAVAFNKGYNNKTPIILGGIATGLAVVMLVIVSIFGTKILNFYKSETEKIIEEARDNINSIDYDNDSFDLEIEDQLNNILE